MPNDDEALDEHEGEPDEAVADGPDEMDDDESSPLMARAKRLRDGPLWLGLAPLVILGAAVAASAFGSVALMLAILFVGAAIWGVVVWRFARDR
jgi:hypothetical protein